MCFDHDATPPIRPISGGSVDHRRIDLTSDGTRFDAFEATTPGARTAVVVLPDVRGLFPFYEELAVRFAEHGFDALAIDYFGRTAADDERGPDWDFMPHVRAMTIEGLRSDVTAAVDHLQKGSSDRPVFIVGFCLGGSNAWHMAASGPPLSGVVGFYGHPDRPDFPAGAPTVMSEVPDIGCPVLALQGGADPGIPSEVNDAFRDAMVAMEVTGEVVEYAGAPHSFFDRAQEEHQAASDDAWARILDFIARHDSR